MDLPFYQVDAFATRAFAGNPAAVMPLETWLPDELMQRIAAENNLAETAFILREPEGWRIRWFTPTVEIDLCGHATLASAKVLLDHIEPTAASVTFASLSGPLTVRRDGERLVLDFPARRARQAAPPAGLVEALGARPSEAYLVDRYLLVFESAEQIRGLAPDFTAMKRITPLSVGVTAPGTGADGDVDFVSRYFTPAHAIDEDPVTGSLHCVAMPYWAARLGRTRLRARQVSTRGGELWCELLGDRVEMAGHAVEVMRGRFTF